MLKWQYNLERMVSILPTYLTKDLISKATFALSEREYSDRSIEYITLTWKNYQKFCNNKGYAEYSPKNTTEFIESLYTHVPPFKQPTINRKIANMKLLELFVENGTWEKGLLHPLPELSSDFIACLKAQDERLVKKYHSESSRSTMHEYISNVLRFFQTLGITTPNEITSEHISQYLLTINGHAKSTIRCELSRLRHFFSDMYALGYFPKDFSNQIPQYNLGQSQSIIKIWNSDEIQKVLEVVDKSSPKGKRDAAFITIAVELGVRSKDISDLKLADIDWEDCSISFVQSKTKKPNILPLSERLGLAIIEYLQIRPQTECEYLFVNLNPPYDKMKSFNKAFLRYVRRSGVKIPANAHHGLHSLRATVATKMLSADISPDIIYPFLGHSDRNTLHSYLRLDIENLRECALSFEDGELI